MIRLKRGHAFEMGTPGALTVGDFQCRTLELPWRGNKVGKSCIPVGMYTLRARRSDVVERSSGGEFLIGWEVCDVPGRTWIMFHPGNSIDDSDGCILTGAYFSGWAVNGNPRWTVAESRATFASFMRALDRREEWTMTIEYCTPGKRWTDVETP